MNTFETILRKDIDIGPLGLAALSATAGTNIKQDNKITITIQENGTPQWEDLLQRIGNDIEFLIQNKELEYLQLIVLKVFLKKILHENFQLQLSSWTSDVAHKVDAILRYQATKYNIDLTLGVKNMERKMKNHSRDNHSHWIVFLSAPGIRNFVPHVLSGYSGDYSQESIILFLEANPAIMDAITCNVIDRKTGKLPTLIRNELALIG